MNLKVVVLFIAYTIVILSLRHVKAKDDRTKKIIRKFVHLSTGLIIFFLTFLFDKPIILLLLIAGTLFSFLTYKIKKYNFIHATSVSSLGTLFYPVGLLSSFLLLYEIPLYYFRISLLLLSISDVLAYLGRYINTYNPRFIIWGEEKSLWGMVIYSISTFFILRILLPGQVSENWLYLALTVIIAVNFELISSKGSDNLTIPLGCSYFFYLTYDQVLKPEVYLILIISLGLASIFFYRYGILTRFGSIAAYFLGIYLFAILGINWSIPIVVFFLTSVLFTKINNHLFKDRDDSAARNLWQVLANSIFAILSSMLYLMSGNILFIYFYISLIAAVTADTWASELGPVFNRKCFSLSDGTIKDSGVTGGISFYGTLAAFGGSVVISVLSYYLFFGKFELKQVFILGFSGFIASFIDSLLGAFVEPRMNKMNYFKSGKGPDSPSPNDVVNLLASFSAPFIYLVLNVIIQ
jgi:uncharacterized protein (TIGR00297 family)